jgi:hypothetical protein
MKAAAGDGGVTDVDCGAPGIRTIQPTAKLTPQHGESVGREPARATFVDGLLSAPPRFSTAACA